MKIFQSSNLPIFQPFNLSTFQCDALGFLQLHSPLTRAPLPLTFLSYFTHISLNSLTNHSVSARGLMSGILQQGYSLGYVLAACANLGVGGATDSWKTVFWIAGELYAA